MAMTTAAMMDSDTDETRTLRMTRVLPAPPARVYRAWTDKDQLGRWFGPKGATCTESDVDARIGGNYRLVLVGDDSGEKNTVTGTFEQLDPDYKIAFTWAWQQDDGSRGHETRIEVTLMPHEQGTEMHFFQQIFQDTPARDKHQGGWVGSFDSLEAYLKGGSSQ